MSGNHTGIIARIPSWSNSRPLSSTTCVASFHPKLFFQSSQSQFQSLSKSLSLFKSYPISYCFFLQLLSIILFLPQTPSPHHSFHQLTSFLKPLFFPHFLINSSLKTSLLILKPFFPKLLPKLFFLSTITSPILSLHLNHSLIQPLSTISHKPL